MTSNTVRVRAWTFTNGYPSTLKLSSLPVPKTPSSQKNLLVKVHACALNPVDIQKMNLPTNSHDRSEKACVMDFCGTVVAAGSETGTGFDVGDEILGLTLSGGVLQEMTELDAGMMVAVRKPAAWSWEKAAGVSLVWLTAKASIEAVAPWVEGKGRRKRVAVLGGSSSTGIYTIVLAKRLGWEVVATSSGRNREFIVEDLKADMHVDYEKEDVREGVAAFEPDAVIDCVGGTECIGLPSSKRYVSIVGDKTGRTMMGGPYTYYDWRHPFVAARQWLRWAKGEIGLGESYDVTILKPKREWLEEAATTLRPEDIYVDSVYKFEDAKDAFERLNTGRAKGKVVIQVKK
ncbi:hypothetical protein AC578_1648 [Pseudocercospora eumusae]|uniref:Enoyl reductase (ER) domain-containing protein n=1 Tax=Pseudocercospora eumusae TaxID=321146 RepID=A0A139HM04_9PEZI|nr:hypothetical protein AC578_1648 [Pseudocercospora eumusae]